MAHNLNTLQINQLTLGFLEGLAQYKQKYTAIGRALSGPAGTVKMGQHILGGVANTLADNATSTTASDIASFEASFTTAEKYVLHKFPKHKLDNEKGLREAGQQMAQIGGKNIDRDFFSTLEGLLTATSPRAGAGVGQVGAAKLYIDTGKKGLQGEAGEFTYANKITSALSEAALFSMVQLMLKWRDDRGLQMNLGAGGNFALVVSAKNLQLAHELTKSAFSGSDMAANYHATIFRGGICTWEFTDDDDYFLVDLDNTPLGYYLSREPSFELAETDDTMFVNLVAKYHGTPVYGPYEYGLVGSDVA